MLAVASGPGTLSTARWMFLSPLGRPMAWFDRYEDQLWRIGGDGVRATAGTTPGSRISILPYRVCVIDGNVIRLKTRPLDRGLKMDAV